jgi:ribosomal protein S18 acetylase RimI-like enzyme
MQHKIIIFTELDVLLESEKLITGVTDLLDRLKQDLYTLCICTEEMPQYINKTLRKYGIEKYFTLVKFSDDYSTKTQCIKHILDECCCCSAIVVGSKDSDMDAALNVKCSYIDAHYDRMVNTNEKVNYYAISPLEIYNAVKKIDTSYKSSSTVVNSEEDIIVLCPVESKHIADINAMALDEETREMLGIVTLSHETYYKDKSNMCFAITEKDGQFIGIVELFDISWKNRRAELSICIKPSYRGNGAAYIAIKKLLYIGFEQVGLNRIWLRVLEYNYKAISLYQKVGFVKEGLCREESLRGGKFANQIQMSLLRDEWLSLNNKTFLRD